MERMHYNVEPLRTDQEIDDFLWAVSQARYGERNRMIVLVGINTGLRMSDILRLKVGQVRGKDRVMIMEQKTGKKRWLFLKNLKTELAHFTRYRGANEPLFCSGRGGALTVKWCLSSLSDGRWVPRAGWYWYSHVAQDVWLSLLSKDSWHCRIDDDFQSFERAGDKTLYWHWAW